MRIVKNICDRCGGDIEGYPIKLIPVLVNPETEEVIKETNLPQQRWQSKKDYCISCLTEILFLANGKDDFNGVEEVKPLEIEDEQAEIEAISGSSDIESEVLVGEIPQNSDNDKKLPKVKNITVGGVNGNSVKIDLPKMFALKAAKWSNKDIAEEFGIKEKQVLNYLYRYKGRV